jgi:hypothetical protein
MGEVQVELTKPTRHRDPGVPVSANPKIMFSPRVLIKFLGFRSKGPSGAFKNIGFLPKGPTFAQGAKQFWGVP